MSHSYSRNIRFLCPGFPAVASIQRQHREVRHTLAQRASAGYRNVGM